MSNTNLGGSQCGALLHRSCEAFLFSFPLQGDEEKECNYFNVISHSKLKVDRSATDDLLVRECIYLIRNINPIISN